MKMLAPSVVLFVALIVVTICSFLIGVQHRYVPTVSVSLSIDNGRTYYENLKSIPSGRDVYLKFTVSIKAKGFWWRFLDNSINFSIKCPDNFKLQDYTGEEPELRCKDGNYIVKVNKTNSTMEEEVYNVSVLNNKKFLCRILVFIQKHFSNQINKDNQTDFTVIKDEIDENYKVTVSKIKAYAYSFSVLALDKSKKSEIIFKLPKDGKNVGKEFCFTLSFDSEHLKHFNKTVTLGYWG